MYGTQFGTAKDLGKILMSGSVRNSSSWLLQLAAARPKLEKEPPRKTSVILIWETRQWWLGRHSLPNFLGFSTMIDGCLNQLLLWIDVAKIYILDTYLNNYVNKVEEFAKVELGCPHLN